MTPKTKKIIKRAVMGVAGGYGVAYLATAISATKLVPQVKPVINELSLSKLKVGLSITVQNPTPVPFSFGTPVIHIYLNDKMIIHSTPSVKRTWIPARGEGKLPDIPLEMTITDGITLGAEILKSILSGLGSTSDFKIRIETKVFMRGLGICPVWKNVVTEVALNPFKKK